MATLEREGSELVVKLSALEKFGAGVRHDVRVPWSAVRYVRVSDSPLRELRGLRLGTAIPGLVALGTWFVRGGRSFAAAHRGSKGVVVELDGTRYRKLVVSCPDAVAVADSLRGELGA
jgi:hypothetical protein